MRVYLGGRRYRVETIGTADDNAAADGVAVLDWRQAQLRARERQATIAGRLGGQEPEPARLYTVGDALADYMSWFEEHRRSAVDARSRIEALILPELGAVELAALTSERVRRWHREAARAPARLRSGKGKEQRHRQHDPEDPEAVRRRRASANRTLTILKAALNRIWRHPPEGREAAVAAFDPETLRKVEPFRDVNAARLRYLQIDECRRLINACAPDFRPLVQGALATGCRYGELCALDVADYLADAGAVHVRKSKTGKGRHVVLTAEGEAFFAAAAAGRSAAEPMFPRADGLRWGPSHQRRPLVKACRGARVEPAADFHSLRHTYASHAVMNGVPLMVLARNLGHADTRMVERHYGHMEESYIRAAIRAGAPTFGVVPESNVVAIRSGTP